MQTEGGEMFPFFHLLAFEIGATVARANLDALFFLPMPPKSWYF